MSRPRFGVTISDLNDFLSPSQACIVAEAPRVAAPAVALHSLPRRAGIIRAVGGGGASGGGPGSAVGLQVSSDAASTALGAGGASGPVTARVSLSDCLACSGCVTSAETVLMEQQSSGELRRLLKEPSLSGVVVMLSPQALASLALYLGSPSMLDAYARLAWFFKRRLGCAAVVDTQVGLDLVLAEAGDEALRRLAAQGAPGAAAQPPPPWLPPPCSLPASATHHRAAPSAPLLANPHPHATPPPPLPVLTSACPGWVCYAEKSAPEALPYVSSLRSPQQATGALVKALLAAWSASSAPAATVAIMPCYEKKLEASRKDFVWEEGCKEVDCVLVAQEVVDMLVEEGFAGGAGLGVEDLGTGLLCTSLPLQAAPPAAAPPAAAAAAAAEAGEGASPWLRLEGLLQAITPSRALAGATAVHGESDGMCAYAYRHVERVLQRLQRSPAAAVLPQHLTPAKALPFVAGRNSDFKEATLVVSAGQWARLQGVYAARGAEGVAHLWAEAEQVEAAAAAVEGEAGAAPITLSFFLAYGFRNIQGIIARLRKRAGAARGTTQGGSSAAAQTSIPAYVEIMACPKGCSNGGGLVKPPGTASEAASASAALAVAALLHANFAAAGEGGGSA